MHDNVSDKKMDKNQQYHMLCKMADINTLSETFYLDPINTDIIDSEDRVKVGMQVLFELMELDGFSHGLYKIDKAFIDYYLAQIDQILGQSLDAILHHPDFQALESAWRSVRTLTEHIDHRSNVVIEILDASKESLSEDFLNAQSIHAAGLYQQVYVQEYDTPGGEPISAIIVNEQFDATADDIQLLSSLSQIGVLAHCPVLTSVGPAFFGKKNFSEVMQIEDLEAYLERSEYAAFNRLRSSEGSRYLGLTLPKFLLRLPYVEGCSKNFRYQEDVFSDSSDRYLWGNAAFTFAANLIRSFKHNGWLVNIRGPESGGKIEGLPLHQYRIGRGIQTKIPSEVLIPETRELIFAQLGFIPLCYYKNTDYACFFSANSAHKPLAYEKPEATANSRINARLPYIFLSARLGHYLKVLQRENIGGTRSPKELESALNAWLQTLITKMNNPSPELMSTHPLREGYVQVTTLVDNPGYYQVQLHAVPHFQVEGIDVQLSLIGQMPATLDSENPWLSS